MCFVDVSIELTNSRINEKPFLFWVINKQGMDFQFESVRGLNDHRSRRAGAEKDTEGSGVAYENHEL